MVKEKGQDCVVTLRVVVFLNCGLSVSLDWYKSPLGHEVAWMVLDMLISVVSIIHSLMALTAALILITIQSIIE